MRIEIDKEEYKDLIETKEEFLKTVRKLDNITIENIKLTDKLQEKEQECEELKEDRERWKSNFNGKVSAIEELLQKFDQLNAEKESLKESLKMFSSTLDWALKSQVELYKRQIDSSVPDDWEYEEVLVLVEQYIEKIKQTLAEIKEIAEVEIECKTYEIENDCFNETRCKALNEHIDFIKQILQKISECEVNSDNE